MRWPIVTLLFVVHAAPAAAQEPRPLPVIRGFISSSAFVQNDAFGFGNGQNALWVRANPVGHSDRVVGADVRNSRLAVFLPEAPLSGRLRTSGTVEIDFFGGFNGAGAFSDEQPVPRLRSVYVDLLLGGTTLRVGQAFTPIFGNVPVSASHLAFPLGYGSAGMIGFRSPGVFVSHAFPATGNGHRIALHAGAFRGSWAGPGDLTDHGSAAEAAAVPQLEARIDVAGTVRDATKWSLYLAGHYDEKNVLRDDAASVLAGRAVAGGGRVDHGRFTLHGNVYGGRAIGQQMGQLAQFGDIGGGGGWLQAGARLGRGWSVWTFGGQDDPDDDDVFEHVAGDVRLRNRLGAVSLQVSAGDYTAGLQWLRASTDWGHRDPAGDERWNRRADQISFSVVYRFSSQTTAAPVAASKPASDKERAP